MWKERDDDPFEAEDLRLDAECGIPDAQFDYGLALLRESRTRADERRALVWLARAARSGHPEAWSELAYAAERGDGLDRRAPRKALRIATRGWRRNREVACCKAAADALEDLGREKESVVWLRRGARLGNASAMCALGVALRYGRGVTADLREMVRWYARAARRGSEYAMFNLSICYRYGEGVERSPARAVRWLGRAARHGHGLAGVRLAEAWIDGYGLPAAPLRGQSELERLAVEEGNATAACELGERRLGGHGLEKDVEDGVRWLRWAVNMGNARAPMVLGVAYINGDDVERDRREAVRLYELAADRGNDVALRNLGLCYQNGTGVERDVLRAIALYEKAAAAGEAEAALWAAEYHLSESGGPSPERAVALLSSVVEEEYPPSLRLLADCLEKGIGCDPDPDEAARLRRLADDNDD